jgi:hypothetical protein
VDLDACTPPSRAWRFVRYYGGAPAYRRKGPPPVVLRLPGPVVMVLTVLPPASGVALLFVRGFDPPLLLKVIFMLSRIGPLPAVSGT